MYIFTRGTGLLWGLRRGNVNWNNLHLLVNLKRILDGWFLEIDSVSSVLGLEPRARWDPLAEATLLPWGDPPYKGKQRSSLKCGRRESKYKVGSLHFMQTKGLRDCRRQQWARQASERGSEFSGSQRDQGAATKEFTELNGTKAETVACLQRQSR